ncbi:MAG: SIS domain-containing protein, partial [Candidatus Roizmanbacteria bacterium]
MIDLDDVKKIIELQSGDLVIKSINNLPQQLKQSFQESYQVEFPEDYKKINSVVVCGMGGSRFPSYIVKELFKEQFTVPYSFNDDYNLPGFVDHNTLVFLSSYSGTTEEVLVCGEKAVEKRAKICGITAGGDLKLFLEKNKFPYYLINPIYNSSGQPRIGFGYFVGGHIGILLKLNLIKEQKEIIEQAIDSLALLIKNFKIDVKKNNNSIKQLAEKLYQRYPYYIVSEFLTGVGNAIANQTNETAKSISGFRIIPELNHHLMEGLKYPDRLKEILTFVFFFSKLYSPKIQKRFSITKEVVEKNN